ncbi:DUF4397 domain-containing protein [Niveibacterium sp. 24ML]|uniref:DUF4397 domain-containing protein n=1 Tax=Niveibacterium sp. 24ML TaxID=2985512 RepID=UPI00226F8B33|nr:DUF4397 domain-containing protein [Niveibacterium sp. 24ML]MCX9155320.1 DUF4397 domain-containing protein [Niveibacterium sp. 24ML]
MTKIRAWLLAAASVAVLSACGGDDDEETHAPATPKSSLRVVHASADAPKVDVYLGGAKALSGVAYTDATAFLSVDAGTPQVIVTPEGAMTPEVIKATLDLKADAFTTVVAVGSLAGGTVEPLVIAEDGSAPTAGNLKLRAGHASPGVPAVDIYVTAPDADLATASPAVPNAAYKAVSGVLQIPGGNYRIRATLAGTKTVAYDSGSVALAAGSDLVALAVPASTGNSPVQLLVLTRAAGTPKLLIADATSQVRVMHASPDAPAVDVLVDGAAALTNVPFPADSGYLSLLSGTRNFKVNAAGTSTTVIDVSPALAAGKSYSVFAVGFLAGIEPLLLEDNRTVVADKAKVRVIHGSPDAPAVDVLANDAVVVPNVPFKGVSGYLEVPAGNYVFKLNLQGTSTTAFTSPSIALEAGKVYTAIAIGSAAGGTNPLTIKLLTDK